MKRYNLKKIKIGNARTIKLAMCDKMKITTPAY